MARPSKTAQAQAPAAAPLSPNKKTRGRHPRAKTPETRLIRIGKVRNLSSPAKNNGVALDVVLVAEVIETGGAFHITYCLVDSWFLNGLSIGRIDYADEVDDIDDLLDGMEELDFDNLFKNLSDDNGNRTEEALDAQVLTVLDSPSVSLQQHNASATKDTDKNLIDAPIEPVQVKRAPPPSARPAGGDDNIDAVVFFVNKCVSKDRLKNARLENLRLPINLQITLAHDETFEEFADYIWDGGDEEEDESDDEDTEPFEGLRPFFENELHDGGLDFWLDYEIYVLPQSPTGRTRAYRWGDDPDLLAHDFLHNDFEERRLYIEILIKPDADYKQKNRDWNAKKARIAATKKMAPRKSAPGGPNRKVKGRKR